jgi:hypothetical protein
MLGAILSWFGSCWDKLLVVFSWFNSLFMRFVKMSIFTLVAPIAVGFAILRIMITAVPNMMMHMGNAMSYAPNGASAALDGGPFAKLNYVFPLDALLATVPLMISMMISAWLYRLLKNHFSVGG